MAFVSQYSDGVNRPRLATKEDMAILTANANAREATVNLANQYKKVKAQREAEVKSKYPNQTFIARCDKIMARLLPAYQKVYG